MLAQRVNQRLAVSLRVWIFLHQADQACFTPAESVQREACSV